MAADERWYFTREELNNSPSRRCGIDAEKELNYRQQAANYIQDMGQRLQVNQLAINTAIVYMHRFYMYHSFTRFHRNAIAPAVLFLAAKVEEQPRKLEHVIKVAYHCLNRDQPALDTQSEIYLEKAQELVVNENILLQTLGFDVAIDHPHSHVVRCCQLVRATKDLAQTSYFMATSSLHMTTMCLQYKPTVVACVCIYIVCTWSHYEIQSVSEGKDWFWYVDKTVTHELLETLTAEFLAILDKFPSRLRKVMNATQHSEERSKSSQAVSSSTGSSRSSLAVGSSSSVSRSHDHNSHAKPGVKGQPPQPHQHQPPQRYNLKEYNEKREKERREREKMRDRDLVDPRDSKQFTLVATSHSSHSAPPSTVQTIASSHANLHPSIPMRSKSGKSSMGGRSSHPEPVKSTGSNHKAHSHGVNLPSRDSQQQVDPLRIPSEASRSDQRRDAMRSDSERYDKSSRTSSSNSNSVVDNRVAGHDVKPSVSDLRQQHMLDIKPSRQSLDAAMDRKSGVKMEAKVMERKPPEIKQEQVKVKNEVKTEVKTEIKEEVKPQYNTTIFNNSDMPEFTLNDFLNDSSFLNLSDGPPEDLFDNSDSESKTDIPGFLDKNLVPQTFHPKLNKSPHLKTKSPHSGHQQQPSNHGQLPSGHGAVTSNAEQRLSESSGVSTSSHHGSRHHHSSSNGSVPASQPQVSSQQQSKSSSSSSNSSSRRSRESERKNSERTEAELIPMVTKLEDTRYRTALNDPATPVKVRAEQAALAAQASAAAAATATTAAAAAAATATPITAAAVATTSVAHSVVTTAAPSSTATTTAPVASIPNTVPPHSSTANTTSKALPVPHSVPAVQSSDQTQWKNSQPPPVLNLKRPRTEVIKEPEGDQSGKKVKYEHSHHKHKEKKKHKHKEKDKNKDREHKEHKEHKKDKKHKKRKDKDKDRDRERSRGSEEGGSAPIRITIAKDKVLYTPEPSGPLRVNTSSAPAAATTLPGSTPGIPKFKIQKNRIKPDLFGSTSTSPESSPAGDRNKDTPTTSLKIRISRDRICSDKEPKKRRRDHSPGGDLHLSKMSRNGSDALSSHNSPQVPIKDLDPSRWSSQRQ